MNEGKSLKDLLCLLADSDIPFVVVGGYAARMHGTSLLTEDIDICAVLSPENIEKLSFIEFPEDTSCINNLYIKTDMGQIDLLGSVSGVGDFDAVSKCAIEITLFGRKCKVISIDDLIKAKKFVGRPHDLETVKQLESIKKRLGDNK